MKLQGLSVFFCLIAVPIILVLTAYVQAQITTISMQLAYDTKLLDATHDAMVALEINTANEDLSTVSDSLRSIVNASTNTFINSLSTNMGMSSATRHALEPYIPAILVTLYDGYYIYSPTQTPIICTDEHGVAVYVGDKGVSQGTGASGYTSYKYDSSSSFELNAELGADYGMLMYKVEGKDEYITSIVEGVTEFKTDYVLKAYIPYAARYKNESGTIDVQVNYTLDNFINIYGEIDGAYYTKSGFFTNIEDISCSVSKLESYSESALDEYFKEHINDSMELTIKVDGEDFTIRSFGDDEEKSAIKYYLKSYVFSNWVRENLGSLKVSDIQEKISEENREAYGSIIIGGRDDLRDEDGNPLANTSIVDFESNGNSIFNHKKSGVAENPEEIDSIFALHKTDVMKNSIQYNLNLAMSSYNEMNLSAYQFGMPIIDDITWDKITSKVSIVSFMQGFKCGLKTYNNYACVSSTNNEFTVIPEEIYYVGPKSSDPTVNGLNDEETKYHRIDCPEFSNIAVAGEPELSNAGVLESICTDPNLNSAEGILEKRVKSFVSKEVKYDKIFDSLESKYAYDHKNSACYKCIVTRNYKSNRGGDVGYYNNLDYGSLSKQAKKVYLIAIAKEREELYKTNQIILTQGVETNGTMGGAQIASNTHTVSNLNTLFNGDCRLSNIKSIDITFTDVTSEDSALAAIAYIRPYVNNYLINNIKESDNLFRLIVNQSAAQTITLNFSDADDVGLLSANDVLSTLQIELYSDTAYNRHPDGFIKYWIDSIKVNYK